MPLIRHVTAFLVLTAVAFGRHAALGFGPLDATPLGSWTFEQFGSDVAILRASTGKLPGHAGDVGVLISCSGPDRRLRLSLQAAIAKTGTVGSAMIMASRQPEQAYGAIVRFTLHRPSELVVSETSGPNRDIAVVIGQMLLTKPRALDIIVSLGTAPASLTHLKAYRLFLSSAPEDIDAVNGFIQACGRSAVRSIP